MSYFRAQLNLISSSVGQIKEQTIRGGIYSYFGVVLGALTTGFLMPHSLSAEQLGVTKLLISYSIIWAQVASLGFNSATTRLFSRFRDLATRHSGFWGLGLMVHLVGFGLSVLGFWFLLPWLLARNANAALFTEYLWYLLPLSFFTMLFNYIDTYFTQLYQAVRGLVWKEFGTRVLVVASLAAYYFGGLGFDAFVVLYVVSWSAPGLVLWWQVLRSGQIGWRPGPLFGRAAYGGELVQVSLFGLLLGFSGMAVLNIDSLMLASMLGADATGIYSVAFFAGTLVVVPSRPLQKIASAFYADAWKNNDLNLIERIYKQSSLNQFVVGGLIFALIWVNTDDLLGLLPPVYAQGKWVVFFIGLANWVDMASGANVVLISTSRHYRLLTLFTVVLLVLIVLTNYTFIPRWGIVGAAAATFASTTAFNLMRWGFLYRRYGLQPWRVRFLGPMTLVALLAWWVAPMHLCPIWWCNILAKSVLSTAIFVVPVWYVGWVPELNGWLRGLQRKWLGRQTD